MAKICGRISRNCPSEKTNYQFPITECRNGKVLTSNLSYYI